MMPDQNGIYITKKQASVSAAVLIILSLLLFVAGYFWGKQSVIDGFTQKTSQESFNDQVDYLLTMQSFAAKNGGLLPDASADEKDQELPDALEEGAEEAKPAVVPTVAVVEQKTVEKPKVVQKGKHFAAIAGFAKKSSALQLVARLKQRHIDVVLKTKTSRSASGKAHKTWYQVVTPTYDSIEQVQALVDKILMFEKIKRSDIKIV